VFHPFRTLGLPAFLGDSRMPRPLKSSRDLRQRFDLYLDEGEIEQIRANAEAARLPMSTFVRRVALRQRIELPPASADLARWRELAPLASNLNQIARACNAGRAEGIDPAVIDSLAEQVRLLRLELLGASGDQPEVRS
jgi:hypothetical protein